MICVKIAAFPLIVAKNGDLFPISHLVVWVSFFFLICMQAAKSAEKACRVSTHA